MAAPTLTERVDELRRELATTRELIIREEMAGDGARKYTQEKLFDLKASDEKLNDKVAALENRLNEVLNRCSPIEAQIKALEKSSDRTWQFAPMVISAVAVLISLIVAFVKK